MSSNEMKEIPRMYLCQYCGKKFSRKTWADKHPFSCVKRKKFEKHNRLHLLRGQKLFNHWQLKTGFIKKKHGTKTLDQFLNSPSFNLFMKLEEFTRKVHLVSPYIYIDWLDDHRVESYKWMADSTVEAFRKWIDTGMDPLEQTRTTIYNICEWAEETKNPTSLFFHKVTNSRFINMVRSRKLSPWVLFTYEPSIDYIEKYLSDESLYQLVELINVEYWIKRIGVMDEKNDETPKLIRQMIDDNIGTL